MKVIELAGFTKRYENGHGVFDLDLSVDAGEFFGFIGENGAGKSTTLRAMLGLLQPTSGRLSLLGQPVEPRSPTLAALRADVGYVPGEPALWEGMRVGEILAYLGSLHDLDSSARRHELLAYFELDPARNAAELSLGNKKKVALIAALQHRPRLLLLDEPTNGLDPLMQQRLFDLLHESQQAGATVFFSSHVLSEVERLCTRVAILRQGRLVALSAIADLRAREARHIEMRRADISHARTPSLEGVRELHIEGDRAAFLYTGPLPLLLRTLSEDDVTDVRIRQPSLEEVVLHHYGRSADAPGAHRDALPAPPTPHG